MTKESSLAVVSQKQVLFMEDELTAVLVEEGSQNVYYVPIRPICSSLSISPAGQRQRVQRDGVLSEVAVNLTIALPGDQARSMLCLPLDFVSGFLFGISAKRVNAEIRDKLLTYQRRCYQVLNEALQEGRLTADVDLEGLLNQDSEAVQAYKMALAVVKLARNQLLLESRMTSHEKELEAHGERLEQIEATLGQPDRLVTPEQASQISQAVKAVALVLSKQTKRNEFGAIYGELYRKFSITSYKALPANQFETTMAWLNEWYQSLTNDDIPF
jgi:hypothetical protein